MWNQECPAVVRDDLRDTVEHGVAPKRHAILHQSLRTGDARHMQPLRPRADAKPGPVQVLDRRLADPLAHHR